MVPEITIITKQMKKKDGAKYEIRQQMIHVLMIV